MSNHATPVAFVTGAARGIGLAIARWFFHQGYRVAVIDNDAPTLTATEAVLRAELGARESDLLVIHGDVSDPAQVAAAVHRNATDLENAPGPLVALGLERDGAEQHLQPVRCRLLDGQRPVVVGL